jgi:hypothetical protein
MNRILFAVGATVLGGLLVAQSPGPQLQLRFEVFDPLEATPAVPASLQANATAQLGIVQFAGTPTQADRERLAEAGLRPLWYLPDDAYVVRGPADARRGLRKRAGVRWVGPFHPAYKLAAELRPDLVGDRTQGERYVVVMADPKHDENGLVQRIERLGGSIWRYAAGNLLLEVDLTPPQLQQVLADDAVLWVERAQPIEHDMDNARIQGGADFLEAQGGTAGGFTGKGVRGHIMEGIFPNHPEYAANSWRVVPASVFSGQATNHGQSTFGIVFANGVDPMARGMCPDGQGFFTDYSWLISTPAMQTGNNSRYGVVREITDPAQPWQCMFQTASWGYPRTLFYDARSAEMDWIIAEFDLPIFQSQSNSGNQMSRPQAWAKNIVSGGAIFHNDTATPADDSASGTSTGPATDGRIKPDLCGYYDSIYTTSGANGYTSGFGGTSGATPMIAGHAAMMLELFTDGAFGLELQPGDDWTNRFARRPHFSTTKALLINTARQYPHAQVGGRYRQGWGFPSLEDLWNLREQMLVLDEQDVLQQGQQRVYTVFVKPGTPQLRATMTFADPAGNPAAVLHRVNDLDLEVTAPDGTVYHGNVGLVSDVFSSPGGAPNDHDTVENCFVQNPMQGLWTVRVSAPEIVVDQHVETAATDADFALVVSGIGAGRDATGAVLDVVSSAPGSMVTTLSNLPTGVAEGYVLYTLATARDRGMGNFLGLEVDDLSLLSVTTPASAGHPLHFTGNAGTAQFPNAPFVWPALVPTLLQGQQLDAVAVFVDANGAFFAASNVARVTVQ